MKVGYTEFSFGYAFTENLIRSTQSRPSGAPVFPNLNQEAHLGYDVHIDFPGYPLFFQYKLPELMVRDSAAEISKHALPGISKPFFRMPLMRRDISQQHQLLIILEEEFQNAVYYASAIIENNNDFSIAYNAAQVHQQSVFFSPTEIGELPDDKQHVIAYRYGLGHAWLCSGEPHKIRAQHYQEVEESLGASFNAPRSRTLDVAAAQVQQVLLSLTTSEIRAAVPAIRQRIRGRRAALAASAGADARAEEISEELLVSREIARIGLGVDMVVAQPAV